MIINLCTTAQCIVDTLKSCGFNDITDSSGYYVIKKFDDGTERCVDVSKSTECGTQVPHYVMYVSYEDDTSKWDRTIGLSIEELADKLDELSK